MNRLRAHEQIQAQVHAGFEVIKEERENYAVSDLIRTQLVPRFASMAESEYSVIKQRLVLRKPHRQI